MVEAAEAAVAGRGWFMDCAPYMVGPGTEPKTTGRG